ncbi:MAG: 50S ribosomal protein L11 methyltransferase [Candidatus Rariloculaceae bacterium]
MSWYQLKIALRAENLPRTETLLKLAGAEAFSIRDAAHTDIVEPEPGTAPLWPDITVKALFRSKSIAAAGHNILASTLDNSTNIRIEQLSDSEWQEIWTKHPATQKIGKNLAIVAASEEWKDPNRVAVRLNLGLAFGTGSHPTTSLCLEWLDSNVRPGARVLDYGCGSGVLAITALSLGAESAWAVDIDRQAILATRENAKLNGMADKLWLGTPDELPAIEVDIIIANILAQPLRGLAARFSDLVVPGGYIVLSGILSGQSDAVQQAYASNFGPFIQQRRKDWACLVAPRI